ncbi:MAG: hypothetical protein LC791_04660 [Acidobacteria bacterium]|nr:hypothetical protein [Acidobacteriota bacterium]
MTFLWIVAATGWVLAMAALMTARGAARRLAQLTEMYWELKYEHGELKARVKTLVGDSSEPPPTAAVQAFVPLGDLKKKP